MNKRIKKLWIKALRSGKYKQTRGWLKEVDDDGKDRYCCLGVLCDLFRINAKSGEWVNVGVGWQSFAAGNQSASVLPVDVVEWAGLDDQNPRLGRTAHASTLNDDGRSFNFIADRIEKYL